MRVRCSPSRMEIYRHLKYHYQQELLYTQAMCSQAGFLKSGTPSSVTDNRGTEGRDANDARV